MSNDPGPDDDMRLRAARMRRDGVSLVDIASELEVTYAEADDLSRRGRNLAVKESADNKNRSMSVRMDRLIKHRNRAIEQRDAARARIVELEAENARLREGRDH